MKYRLKLIFVLSLFRFLLFSLLVSFCDVVEYEMRDLGVSVRGHCLGLVYLHQGSAKKCVSQSASVSTRQALSVPHPDIQARAAANRGKGSLKKNG